MKTTVLIADDHTIVRQGLRAILATDPKLQVVGEADNGLDAIKLTRQLKPNILLLDLVLPKLHGSMVVQKLQDHLRTTSIIILSTYFQREDFKEILSAGIKGYLLKHSAAAELLDAIHRVTAGKQVYSAAIAQTMGRERLFPGNAAATDLELSPRQKEVLALVAGGSANKQIADLLGISIKTVEKHRQQLMEKLDIHDVAGLTRYAFARGVAPTSALAVPKTGTYQHRAGI